MTKLEELKEILNNKNASGVKEIYADIISSLVIPILEENNVKYEFLNKVDYIKNKEGTGMCPMEMRFKDEQNINNIYNEIIAKM